MELASSEDDARFETTAAWQAAEASTNKLQQDVEKNAEKAHTVAGQAAASAQFNAPAAERAVEELEEGLSEKTNAAVVQGQSDSVGYVETARTMASSALAAAASYLPSSTTTSNTGTGIASSLQSAAGTAVETTKNVLSSAAQAAQPHVESARAAAQPSIDSARAAAQPHIDRVSAAISGTPQTSEATTKPAEVPATTAPLESSGGIVGGPYPPGQTSKVASV
ncbi:hypothetical protein PHLCEN_2v3823 [Hermanssonia centrifuga]|uniref:Uncharacterized protein n=1 Tax=Hermanssonia centrifuga TaxID=98765 RepID=A0A2R6QBD0_9APHY|nr:hypothetical protein PHLCEN_2v3823 [Hermanssonia centrifuga]